VQYSAIFGVNYLVGTITSHSRNEARRAVELGGFP
jgi:hypothetical protein